MYSLPIPIGRKAEAEAKRLALRTIWAEPCWFLKIPAHAPIVQQRIEVENKPHWFCVWLPGPHPKDAAWCEELSAWVRVSRCA